MHSKSIQIDIWLFYCKQEKRAFLFCKEDRAILCRQCDISIHGGNEHTKYHNRFLLAGVKLSGSSSCYDSSSDQALCSSNSIGSSEADSKKSSIVSGKQKVKAPYKNSTSANNHCDRLSHEKTVSMEASSISDYLMETLPGWHVEEFLDHPYGGLYEVCTRKKLMLYFENAIIRTDHMWFKT